MKEKMGMALDQPGGKGIVRQIDHPPPVWRGHFRGRTGLLDPLAVDQNNPSGMQFLAIEDRLGAKENRACWIRRHRRKPKHEGCSQGKHFPRAGNHARTPASKTCPPDRGLVRDGQWFQIPWPNEKAGAYLSPGTVTLTCAKAKSGELKVASAVTVLNFPPAAGIVLVMWTPPVFLGSLEKSTGAVAWARRLSTAKRVPVGPSLCASAVRVISCPLWSVSAQP